MGDFIDIQWEDGTDRWYVRGHVDEQEAIDVVRRALEVEVEDEQRETVPRLGRVRHLYARWGFWFDFDAGRTRPGAWMCPVEKTRGAFAVTEVLDLDMDDLVSARLRAEAEHAAELEALVRARYPEATDVRGHGYPVGDGHVRFRLPGLAGDLTVAASDLGRVWVQNRDLPAFKRMYQGRAPHAQEGT